MLTIDAKDSEQKLVGDMTLVHVSSDITGFLMNSGGFPLYAEMDIADTTRLYQAFFDAYTGELFTDNICVGGYDLQVETPVQHELQVAVDDIALSFDHREIGFFVDRMGAYVDMHKLKQYEEPV